MASSVNTDTLEQLRSALREAGIDGGLKFLNQRIDHRYTAVYRLQDARLTNLGLYDKAGEMKPEYLAEVPLDVSFCQFVLRDGSFATGNSAEDGRLDGHPYQGVMMAYHGVPVSDARGRLVGTLCHFDLVERGLSDDDFLLMQQAAGAMREFIGKD
jgi:GAF domain-containing protein